jgi:hypothetical protein
MQKNLGQKNDLAPSYFFATDFFALSFPACSKRDYGWALF